MMQIKHRFSGKILFECELSKEEEKLDFSFRLGVAIKKAIGASADLSSADLSYANLRSADLRLADLRYADLHSADLRYADLSFADLRSADLRLADLRLADLSSANLRSADLSSADLHSADLRSADLRLADLSSANLRSADLSSANLSYANFRSANGAELAIARTRILPEGDIIGWKKCDNNVIVKLLIPKEAKRSHAFGRKCRAEFADVLEVIGGGEAKTTKFYQITEYKIGDRVYPSGFDDDWMKECSKGIHFYITKEEAEAH